MKLIVGLGNYGVRYADTRHNVGYDTIEALVNRHNCPSKFVINDKGDTLSIAYAYEKLSTILMLPIKGRMNNSGHPVKEMLGVIGDSLEDTIVIHDDMDFDPGIVRIKHGGGDGKHNGVKSLINCIGPDFTRVRIGIGKPKSKEVGRDFVLSTFNKTERKLIDDAIITAMCAVEHLIEHGLQSTMQVYNRRDDDGEEV